VSARVGDGAGSTEMLQRALAVRPSPGPDGRMPDPRTREGLADLYAYAGALGGYKRRHPGDDVMSNLVGEVDAHGGRVSPEEFENLFFLFSVAGNETLRNGIPGGLVALMEHPDAQRRLRARFSAGLDLPGEVEPAGQPVRLRSNFQNGIKSLPVRWRRRG